MNIIVIILLAVAGIVFLLLLAALFLKKQHYTRRTIVINAPQQKVFDYVKFLKHQDEFNKNAKAGGEREKKFTGTDGTAGYIYAWKGDKNAGEGEKEIIKIVEGKLVETEIRFIKPMKVQSRMIMETEVIQDNQTRVYWSNAGALKYPFNLFIPMLEKHVARDMDSSLVTLKSILETKNR